MGDTRAYVVALDVLDPTLDVSAVKAVIKSSPVFGGWWNHLPGVFLVTTDRDAEAISAALRPVTGESSVLVIGADLGDSQGWLPSPAWDWVQRRAAPSDELASAAE